MIMCVSRVALPAILDLTSKDCPVLPQTLYENVITEYSGPSYIELVPVLGGARCNFV